ncbi:ATP-binding protein [Nonomuraea dietziae]|uniref:ATP-binding protein n=1 Tax=Nonomuraea dietziae TaxID=65515 RepID=UPI0033EAA8AF
MTITAIAADEPDDREQHLLQQAFGRASSPLDVPRADLGTPAFLEGASPEARAKALAALNRANNVIHLHPDAASDSCTCPRAGQPGYTPGVSRTCPACQQERVELAETVAAQQREFRLAAWRRCLEGTYADYAHADIAKLEPHQNPEGKVSGWLDADSRTLVLVGTNSVGKTHTAFAIGNQAAHRAKPWWTVAWNVADLNDQLRPGGPIRVYEYAERCDLLILDDLGAEKISEWTLEQLYRLLDSRVRNRRRTIITTNLPYDERGFADTPADKRPVNPNMIGRYGARVVHRIMHEATVVRVVGESWRKPVPW